MCSVLGVPPPPLPPLPRLDPRGCWQPSSNGHHDLAALGHRHLSPQYMAASLLSSTYLPSPCTRSPSAPDRTAHDYALAGMESTHHPTLYRPCPFRPRPDRNPLIRVLRQPTHRSGRFWMTPPLRALASHTSPRHMILRYGTQRDRAYEALLLDDIELGLATFTAEFT